MKKYFLVLITLVFMGCASKEYSLENYNEKSNNIDEYINSYTTSEYSEANQTIDNIEYGGKCDDPRKSITMFDDEGNVWEECLSDLDY